MIAFVGGIVTIAFIVYLVLAIRSRKKGSPKAKQQFRIMWILLAAVIVLAIVDPNKDKTTQTAQPELIAATQETAKAEPTRTDTKATGTDTKTTAEPTQVESAEVSDKETNEPSIAEWQESYKGILLGEAQSYIELSVRGTLSKERFDSAVGVLEKYATKVAPDQQEAFKQLADTVKANDLDSTKKQFKLLGGKDFPELSKDAKPISFN